MEELELSVKKIVANAIGLEMDEFDNDTHLYNDLGADSVIGFEIIAKLQKKYQIIIGAEDVSKLMSVSSIAEYISEKTSASVS